MMKILMLNGAPDTGKTTSLNIVYDKLIELGAVIINEKTTLGNPAQHDFECIVSYKNKKIAFFTMGDYSDVLTDAIDKYDKLCDVLIMANSNKARPLVKFAQHHRSTVFCKIADSNNQQAANKKDADEIISSI